MVLPMQQYIAKEVEFARLRNSIIRSEDDEKRYWELMEYFLLNFAAWVTPPYETGPMLEKFKSRKLLANQHTIERKVEILKKLRN